MGLVEEASLDRKTIATILRFRRRLNRTTEWNQSAANHTPELNETKRNHPTPEPSYRPISRADTCTLVKCIHLHTNALVLHPPCEAMCHAPCRMLACTLTPIPSANRNTHTHSKQASEHTKKKKAKKSTLTRAKPFATKTVVEYLSPLSSYNKLSRTVSHIYFGRTSPIRPSFSILIISIETLVLILTLNEVNCPY